MARAVELKQTTNAHAHLLPNEAGDESTEVRVRIVNASNSTGDNFQIGWQSERESRERLTYVGESMIAAYVPAGQSRVIRLPRGSEQLTADRIVLSGDEHSFDNTFFVVPPRKLELKIPYFGSDTADDPQGMSYYLRLAVANDPLRQVDVTPLDDLKSLALPPDLAPKLVVVSQSLADDWQAALRTYVEQGGLLRFVIRDDDAAKSASSLLSDLEFDTNPNVADVPAVSGEASDKYLLLGDIDFAHPLFAPNNQRLNVEISCQMVQAGESA